MSKSKKCAIRQTDSLHAYKTFARSLLRQNEKRYALVTKGITLFLKETLAEEANVFKARINPLLLAEGKKRVLKWHQQRNENLGSKRTERKFHRKSVRGFPYRPPLSTRAKRFLNISPARTAPRLLIKKAGQLARRSFLFGPPFSLFYGDAMTPAISFAYSGLAGCLHTRPPSREFIPTEGKKYLYSSLVEKFAYTEETSSLEYSFYCTCF